MLYLHLLLFVSCDCGLAYSESKVDPLLHGHLPFKARSYLPLTSAFSLTLGSMGSMLAYDTVHTLC